jgi:glycosyltransferase involved in cell wall biosynthesis
VEIVLSIVIPTHNRADDLIENLASLLPQIGGMPVEIIVVDSASSTEHRAALEPVRRMEAVTLISLDRPGVSVARNSGVAHASGTWLGFLDDDVVPAPDWVERALARIQSSHNMIGVIAGRVVPRWPSVTAGWTFDPASLGRRSRVLLSMLDGTRDYCTSTEPFGITANLLVRRDALAQAGGFPEDMGRIGNSLASGEDPYVIDEIVRNGFDSWYDGLLCVEHKIYAKQLTPAWMARRAWHEGYVSFRKCRSTRVRATMKAKCLASLPALAVLRFVRSSQADNIVRLHHNLGFLSAAIGIGYVGRMVARRRRQAVKNRDPEQHRFSAAATPSVAAAFPHDDAGG